MPAEELVERFSRSSGPGGQSVNTTDSRVELVFEGGASSVLTPAERDRVGTIRVVAAEHRSQHRNRVAARDRLAGRDPGGPRPATPDPGAHQAVEVLPPAPGRGQEAPRPDQGAARPRPRLAELPVPRAESPVARAELPVPDSRVATRRARVATRRAGVATHRRRRRARPGRPTSTSSGPRSPREHEERADGAEDDHVDGHRVGLLGQPQALGPHPHVERVQGERHRAGAEDHGDDASPAAAAAGRGRAGRARSRPARCRWSAPGRTWCRCGAPRPAATRCGCRSGWCRTTRCAPGPAPAR